MHKKYTTHLKNHKKKPTLFDKKLSNIHNKKSFYI